jgi:hypothetical protein
MEPPCLGRTLRGPPLAKYLRLLRGPSSGKNTGIPEAVVPLQQGSERARSLGQAATSLDIGSWAISEPSINVSIIRPSRFVKSRRPFTIPSTNCSIASKRPARLRSPAELRVALAQTLTNHPEDRLFSDRPIFFVRLLGHCRISKTGQSTNHNMWGQSGLDYTIC